MTHNELKERRKLLSSETQKTLSNMKIIKTETERVQSVAHNAESILDDLDAQFEEKTGLTKIDVTFLFFAVALQIARQYLVTKFPNRLNDQEAANNTFGHKEEHSDRTHRLYNPSLEEIITNPVPFDANIGADGALSGGGKLGHRVTTLGHDPVLGLIFGTANIATSTLTNYKLQSFHIKTSDLNRDYFANKAHTDLVFWYAGDKLFKQGFAGKKIMVTSLIKEIIHLKTDLDTKNSLPLPLISLYDPKLASNLADYGIDMSNVVNVGKQIALASFINWLISTIHGLFYFIDENQTERSLYEVRTRKILMYSNVIASVSNLAVVGITKNLKLLDVGGLIVTLHRIYTDQIFIRNVKREFVLGEFNKLIEGEELKLQEFNLI
ncbi:MAG: hypothetical protein SPH83_03925 [Treponema sp.]|nr:hypothetical protein [Treponema sp.]